MGKYNQTHHAITNQPIAATYLSVKFDKDHRPILKSDDTDPGNYPLLSASQCSAPTGKKVRLLLKRFETFNKVQYESELDLLKNNVAILQTNSLWTLSCEKYLSSLQVQ